jgi:glyoxylase-like metal-dependent hydrolase (beta-lactamase superfamily II)
LRYHPPWRQWLDDARSEDDYTIREWVEAPGVRYVPVDGELELLPGLRLVPASGHTRGLQVVVVETGGPPVVVGGDVAVRAWWRGLIARRERYGLHPETHANSLPPVSLTGE